MKNPPPTVNSIPEETPIDGVPDHVNKDPNVWPATQSLEKYLEDKASRAWAEKEGPTKEDQIRSIPGWEPHVFQRKTFREMIDHSHLNSTIGKSSNDTGFLITDAECSPGVFQKLIELFRNGENPDNWSAIYALTSGRFGDGKTRMTQMLIDEAVRKIKAEQVGPKLPEHLPQTFIFSDVGPAGELRRALLRVGTLPEVEVLSSSHLGFPDSDWKFSWHNPSVTKQKKQKLALAQPYSKHAKKNPLAFLKDKLEKKAKLLGSNPFIKKKDVA